MHERQKAMNICKALEEETKFEYSDEELKMVELEQERAIDKCSHRINSRVARGKSIKEEYKT